MKTKADRLTETAPLMLKLIKRATSVLSWHVLPVTKMTDQRAILEFYSIFDGPDFRTMMRKLHGRKASSSSKTDRTSHHLGKRVRVRAS